MFNPLMQQTTKIMQEHWLPANFTVIELGNQTFVGEDHTVKSYYESLGASDYIALDVNERLDAIICDLNYPIMDQQSYHDLKYPKFDFVTNNGTSEHLFNQAMVFQNIHTLCKKDGFMLHVLPLTPWINHGFFNYNPILFRDLSRVNGYEIQFYHIADRWGNKEKALDPKELFREKHPNALIQTIQRIYSTVQGEVFNVVCLKKTNNDEFKFPIQGKYLKDIEGNISSEK